VAGESTYQRRASDLEDTGQSIGHGTAKATHVGMPATSRQGHFFGFIRFELRWVGTWRLPIPFSR